MGDITGSDLARRTLLGAAVACYLSAGFARGAELPKPDRFGAPDSKLCDYGVMGPPAKPAIVDAAVAALRTPAAAGPTQPTWVSVAANYRTPAWFSDAPFGIYIHWGLYSVAARHNEWYEKHMYTNVEKGWHAEHFGPHERLATRTSFPGSRPRDTIRTNGQPCSRRRARASSCRRPNTTTTLLCGTARSRPSTPRRWGRSAT